MPPTTSESSFFKFLSRYQITMLVQVLLEADHKDMIKCARTAKREMLALKEKGAGEVWERLR